MKLYTYDSNFAGGIAIVAESREEASRILEEAKLNRYYGSDEGETWTVRPSAWKESSFNKPVLFAGDQ
jgi:hypothetical protein